MAPVIRTVLILLLVPALTLAAGELLQKDTISTSSGPLVITFIGHGSLMMHFNGHTIHVDPFGSLTEYAALPKADLLLITHQHHDHMDLGAIEKISTSSTRVMLTEACTAELKGGTVMANGDTRKELGITIEAVPAYNVVHKRSGDGPFHPRGEGNGYVLTFGDTRVYIAGDTENIPEMKALRHIAVAFLPMNLPYTMTPEMVADAARGFRPRVLYPYHFGETDPALLVKLLKDEPEIDVRIRKMK